MLEHEQQRAQSEASRCYRVNFILMDEDGCEHQLKPLEPQREPVQGEYLARPDCWVACQPRPVPCSFN